MAVVNGIDPTRAHGRLSVDTTVLVCLLSALI